MKKEQTFEASLNLTLTYSEMQLLKSLVREDVRRRNESGTISDWHETARSLQAKLDAELGSPAEGTDAPRVSVL
jgi:hypothetical protein